MIAIAELRMSHTNNSWIKHTLGGSYSFSLVDFNNSTVWQLMRTFRLGKFVVTPLHLGVIIHGNMAHFFFYLSNHLVVVHVDCSTRFLHFLHQLVCDFLTSNVYRLYGVGKGVPFENGHCISDSFTALSYQTSRCTVGEQRQNSRVLQSERLDFKCFKHYLSQTMFVFFAAQGTVSHQDCGLVRVDTQFSLEDILKEVR